MDQVRVARSPTSGAREAGKHQGQDERELRPPAQVSCHSRPVRNAEVAEARRRHHFYLDVPLPDPPHLIGDEQTGDVTRPARV